ncbi:hypothetical protein Ddc_08025 [Ditylenchus destructor]|nr:hypothetical protein Ddc_08025 [Ditylenchus destructor]
MEEYPVVFSHPHSPPQITPHTVNIELSSRHHYISNGAPKRAQIRFPEGTPAISHKIDAIETSQAKREKSETVPKWATLEQNFFRSLDSLSSLKWIDKIGQVMARCTSCIAGQAANIVSIIASPSQVITVKEKVHSRHLELEPLCCLSSCLVRGGCYAILVFELLYIVVTLFIVGFKIYSSGRLNFWDEFEENFNEVVTHQLWLYLLVVFDLVTIAAGFTLFRVCPKFRRSTDMDIGQYRSSSLLWRANSIAIMGNHCRQKLL